MTATLFRNRPVDHLPAGPAVRRPGRRRSLGLGLSSPSALRALLVGLVLLSLCWGAFGGWAAAEHSSAASALVTVDEPLSLDAQQMYEAIADADATITAAYLASAQPSLQPLKRYQNDLATASADLSRLGAGDGSRAMAGSLAALNRGLPAYQGYVGQAQAEFAMGYPLTGGSFLQVASEEAHLVLLPAANAVFTRENAALSAASGEATALPLVFVALALALITAFVLYRAQRWLARRTNRMLSPGLVLASLLLVISVIWLAVGFLSARSDLDRGIGHGSAPAESLALASIGVQQIRGDAVLNVISRSGNTSFSDDFQSVSKDVGPGPGSWLSTAAGAQQDTRSGAALVADAARAAPAWYAANAKVYALGGVADFNSEREAIVGTGFSYLNTVVGYDTLETDLDQAIAADQAVFASAATQGAHALDSLAWVAIAASLLMAGGCGWAFSRRLAEYR